MKHKVLLDIHYFDSGDSFFVLSQALQSTHAARDRNAQSLLLFDKHSHNAPNPLKTIKSICIQKNYNEIKRETRISTVKLF